MVGVTAGMDTRQRARFHAVQCADLAARRRRMLTALDDNPLADSDNEEPWPPAVTLADVEHARRVNSLCPPPTRPSHDQPDPCGLILDIVLTGQDGRWFSAAEVRGRHTVNEAGKRLLALWRAGRLLRRRTGLCSRDGCAYVYRLASYGEG